MLNQNNFDERNFNKVMKNEKKNWMYRTLIVKTFFQQILSHIITYFHTLSYTPLTETENYFIIKIK